MFGRSKIDNYIYFSQQSDSDIRANERLKEKLDFLALSHVRRNSVTLLKKSIMKIAMKFWIIFIIGYWQYPSFLK